MDDSHVAQLLALNRAFYAQFAHDFAETRSAARVNLTPIMPYLADGDKLLDVGCGNGRWLERLDRAGLRLDYCGVDVTPELIGLAEARVPRLRHSRTQFLVADITQRDWHRALAMLAPFNVALMLAVLHHMPRVALRQQVLREVRALLRGGGTLVLSNWQFTRDTRIGHKQVAWQALGIDEREVEEGDALLAWKRGGTGCRYVHLLTQAEVSALAAASGFGVVTQFEADRDLNLYSVLRAV